MKKKYICEECGSTMHRQVTKQTFHFNGNDYVISGIVRYVCPHCENGVFPARECRKVDRLIREMDKPTKGKWRYNKPILTGFPLVSEGCKTRRPPDPPGFSASPTRDCLHVFCGNERERYKKFRDEHYASCKNAGNYVVTLHGTGIGETIQILCPVCGAEEDITDTTAW